MRRWLQRIRYLKARELMWRSVSFETFPHAVACALAGMTISAKKKSSVRRKLLQQCGVDAKQLRNIDYVDAAMCAIVAQRLLSGKYRCFGDAGEGMLVVPQ
jgi:predicted RNase H-like nuclease